MLRKTIMYHDLDGNVITEDFYFNLSKAELAEMELSQEGGLREHLKRIIEKKNAREIIITFKEILAKSYGKRSEDGRRFIKSEELSTAFMQTEAYSELFMELVTDAEASSAFIRGVVPSDMSEKLENMKEPIEVELPSEPAKVPSFKTPDTATNPVESWPRRDAGVPSEKELLEMSREELIERYKNNQPWAQ